MTADLRLTARPLSAAAAYRSLGRPGAGGVALFVGRVRPDRVRGGRVRALDYEVDRPVALAQLHRLLQGAERRFRPDRLLVWHRTGRVGVDEIAVIVGAACGHRDAAFRAARYLIEEVKRTVPIWKTERARPARRPPPRRAPRVGRSTG